MRALVRLMTVPAEKRDAGWLAEGLQAAIQLELSTIPPYLYAAWSIDRSAPATDPANVYDAIKNIAEEEMLHVGIACNLLAAIGGQPMILRAASRYPAQLPKDIHAGLSVALAPLTPELVLKTFMAIEEPAAHLVDDPDFTPSGSLLIGQFYGALLQTFEALSPPISATGQVDMSGLFSSFNVHAPFGVSFIIGSLDDVRAGIGPRSQTQPDEPVQLHRTRGHDAARASGVAG